MPEYIIDPGTLDVQTMQIPIEKVREVNRQRYEMEQIDGIIKYDTDAEIVVAVKHVGDDEHWVRGHIPGRPLMPGVLICECAAQTCSYYYTRSHEGVDFLGFGGMDQIRFRAEVVPGDTLVMAARPLVLRSRMAKFEAQGMVGDRIVFTGIIIGVPL